MTPLFAERKRLYQKALKNKIVNNLYTIHKTKGLCYIHHIKKKQLKFSISHEFSYRLHPVSKESFIFSLDEYHDSYTITLTEEEFLKKLRTKQEIAIEFPEYLI